MRPGPPAEAVTQNRRNAAFSGFALAASARAAEFAAVLLLGLALRQGLAPGGDVAPVLVVPFVAVAFSLFARASGAYSLAILRKPFQGWLRAAFTWAGAALATLALGVILGAEGLSREWFGVWTATGLPALFFIRLGAALAAFLLARRGKLDRYVVIVGGGRPAEDLLRALSEPPLPDTRILGLFDDRGDDRTPDVVAGYPKLGTIDDLIGFARNVRVDQILFALPVHAETRILDILRRLWVLPTDIRLAAHANRLRFRPRAYSFLGEAPLFDLLDKPMSEAAIATKAAFDRVVGLAVALLFAPVMLAVAAGVKLTSPGPVLFRQERFGFNNERITIYKFRSLHLDRCDLEASRLVTRDDPRVTPFGRFIRRTSLDELPQLFNVLKGDLSLVGPRPHAPGAKAADCEYEKVVDGYFARHRVKPGVTGWAQVKGWRGETDTFEKIQRRVDHDLDYIENWSIWLDLAILALTPFALARSPNAY
ncbi:undecaprenyl-phosphate glucose phosphotransferase [Rhodoblastus acidophilus]|uniref:Undecaprenyl-phosphate glucose phosphotransferase n=1 Tax=Candidatus Rhodoblastus alkanivorans TaxID=2954117 RepID=A0ABS9Z9G6_9HYPH|nr:undecaprenyl-phosphate glucose phosphotransferase [Candidatus Rhodoblastus alkanivorans]MCI4679822.1 undecaprenyl-phosphate glucose phosphotransferase [Candidatus Rhodoblastus alkanivorans]MCI4684328.1 undecaprenyl-phosphate glucose phosphotransferase [Candidatus Rhodoblastus alkanivorans]MDI4641649.1 undecaprenyl-phosphate glucose phosphotransferase [Rhodoblastus acidophilus]